MEPKPNTYQLSSLAKEYIPKFGYFHFPSGSKIEIIDNQDRSIALLDNWQMVAEYIRYRIEARHVKEIKLLQKFISELEPIK